MFSIGKVRVSMLLCNCSIALNSQLILALGLILREFSKKLRGFPSFYCEIKRIFVSKYKTYDNEKVCILFD